MNPVLLLSLVVLAFLIFMVIVLLYIHNAAKSEISKVKLKMLVRFSAELCEEMHNLEELPPEERVQRAYEILKNVINDWNIDVDYDKHKVRSKLRKFVQQ